VNSISFLEAASGLHPIAITKFDPQLIFSICFPLRATIGNG